MAGERLCLYGTVLNSVNTVHDSLLSAFRPEYEKIVVVDGGSTDGTYEKLMELRKDFNLDVYRLPGASRGRGRDYALRKCPEGSYAAFFDLDDRLTEWYHRALEWGASTGEPNPLHWLHLRDYAVARGGWRDLNYGEDYEFVARVKFKYQVPLITSVPVNVSWSELHERRYAGGGLKRLRRLIRLQIDNTRGIAINPPEYFYYIRSAPSAYAALLGLITYPVSLAKGLYRNYRQYDNYVASLKMAVEGLVDPRETVGAPRSEAFLNLSPLAAVYKLGINYVASKVKERLPWAALYECRVRRLYGALVLVGNPKRFREVAELKGGIVLRALSAGRCSEIAT